MQTGSKSVNPSRLAVTAILTKERSWKDVSQLSASKLHQVGDSDRRKPLAVARFRAVAWQSRIPFVSDEPRILLAHFSVQQIFGSTSNQHEEQPMTSFSEILPHYFLASRNL